MLAKKRCREVPRCKFQSEMFEAVKAFERKNMFSQNRCILRLEFMCKWKIGTKMAHIQIYPNYVKMSTHRTLCFILQALNYVCIYMVQNCTWHLFISPKESKLKAVAHLSSLSSLHGAIPRRPRRRRPSTAELLEGSTTPIHPETLQSMNSLLCSRGSWGRAEVFGVRGDLPGRFTRAFFGLAKAWSVDFRFVSRYCWMIFGRTNAHLFKRMNVGHGWTPMCKIVTMKLGQINDMPMKRCISMHLGDPHPRSCSQSFPGWNWQPTKTTEFILIC